MISRLGGFNYWLGITALMGLLSFSSCVWQPAEELLFENSDFEKGTLLNWEASGEAMSSQPTRDDNTAPRRGEPVNHQGYYWVGTYENRKTPVAQLGQTQGDFPRGTLSSMPFSIRFKKIRFLIGGGDASELTGVGLLVDGKKVLFEPGRGLYSNREQMVSVTWDVSAWVGRKVQIVIVDESQKNWGHINADNFHYVKHMT